MYTGSGTQNSGTLSLSTGVAGASSGSVLIGSDNASGGRSGSTTISGGQVTSAPVGGDITLSSGKSIGASGGAVFI
jgi:hypothetical protein